MPSSTGRAPRLEAMVRNFHAELLCIGRGRQLMGTPRHDVLPQFFTAFGAFGPRPHSNCAREPRLGCVRRKVPARFLPASFSPRLVWRLGYGKSWSSHGSSRSCSPRPLIGVLRLRWPFARAGPLFVQHVCLGCGGCATGNQRGGGQPSTLAGAAPSQDNSHSMFSARVFFFAHCSTSSRAAPRLRLTTRSRTQSTVSP